MKHNSLYILALSALFNSEVNAAPINLLPNIIVEREMWMNIAREDGNIWSIRVEDIPTTPIAEPAMWVRVTNDRGDGSQRLVAFDCSSGQARELQRVETVAGFRRTANYGAEPVAVTPGTPMARALALACDAHG